MEKNHHRLEHVHIRDSNRHLRQARRLAQPAPRLAAGAGACRRLDLGASFLRAIFMRASLCGFIIRFDGQFEEGFMTKTFEIGLTMAGAISAGAYTAGVMDFLFEALDAYHAAKKEPGWDGPTHDVKISIMSGASAGGMTSAICALHAFRGVFDHVWPEDPDRSKPRRRRNRLYSSWVEDIDIRRLLETTDIDKAANGEPARSLLCCDVIDQIVAEAFELDGPIAPREWIGRSGDSSLRLRLTVTNLRGVPYSFEIYGAADPRRYGMLNHGEFIDFKIGIDPKPENGVHCLDIRDTTTPEWELFRTAAKATGAFPIGLAPRRLSRHPSEYHYASRVGYDVPDGYRVIPPDRWIDDQKQDPYKFISVDGGTIDNEPLEMTRRYLSGGPNIRNASDGIRTDRAVILIAPFPNYLEATIQEQGSAELNKDLGLMNISTTLFSALISQARFKPDELARAADDAYYSRYLVAPTRDDVGTPESRKYPIACGVMGGFGGVPAPVLPATRLSARKAQCAGLSALAFQSAGRGGAVRGLRGRARKMAGAKAQQRRGQTAADDKSRRSGRISDRAADGGAVEGDRHSPRRLSGARRIVQAGSARRSSQPHPGKSAKSRRAARRRRFARQRSLVRLAGAPGREARWNRFRLQESDRSRRSGGRRRQEGIFPAALRIMGRRAVDAPTFRLTSSFLPASQPREPPWRRPAGPCARSWRPRAAS
jgi:hypothetical protein